MDRTAPPIGFLAAAPVTDEVRHLFDDDVEEVGYVMNVSRLWAYQPGSVRGLFELMRQATSVRPFTFRERAILVTACAAAYRDSYCSLAWGSKLASHAGPVLAAGVLTGDDSALSGAERALAAWARAVARDPNRTDPQQVDALRAVGYDDTDIFAMTVFVALRIALSTVNDALGVRPDSRLGASAPPEVLDAISYGRPIDDDPTAAVTR